MSKFKVILMISAVILAALILNAVPAATDVGGAWDFKMATPRGERISTLTFVQDGAKLAVTMVNDRGESKGEGTIKDNDIQWSTTRKNPQGDFTITYKGKVEGTTMSGEAEVGDRGTMKWSATKKAA
jgi:hypothetical protein